ncbi:MAG: SPFH domain-containing protein [Candidatus Binatia bacterium]
MVGSIAIFITIVPAAALVSLKIFREYERGVVFRLGRLVPFRGPGLSFVIPFGPGWPGTLTMNVPPQDIITRDNVSVKIAAVVYFRVLDPNSALT